MHPHAVASVPASHIWTPVPPKPAPITLGRVVEVLETAWDGVLAWDEFAQRLVFRKEPPLVGRPGEPVVGKPVRDGDFDRIRLWFEESRTMIVSKQHVIDGVRLAGRSRAFHPVREYLRGVTWDGKPRVDEWLETFCAVKPRTQELKSLTRAVARSWLVACVARAMQPGCKVDSLLVLEGRQGIGKSKALAALAGDGYFSDALIDFGTKDACQTIQGVWIFELAELDAIVRGGTSQAKAFVTRAVDRFRQPFGRVAESIPRSVVFGGTVNHRGYLKDTTGNRRFWTVRCEGELDVAGLRAARDQLWAEARALYERGVAWHLTKEDEASMREEHVERMEVDPWDEVIRSWAESRGEAAFGINELLEGALGMKAQSRNPKVTRRVVPILEGLGYEKRRAGARGERVYLYGRVG
jgi:putative DNA primase/helicase